MTHAKIYQFEQGVGYAENTLQAIAEHLEDALETMCRQEGIVAGVGDILTELMYKSEESIDYLNQILARYAQRDCAFRLAQPSHVVFRNDLYNAVAEQVLFYYLHEYSPQQSPLANDILDAATTSLQRIYPDKQQLRRHYSAFSCSQEQKRTRGATIWWLDQLTARSSTWWSFQQAVKRFIDAKISLQDVDFTRFNSAFRLLEESWIQLP
ncbi:hypothetical protein D6774_03635 [Candidatus Woesearchaeota archaeon]|nr:MAG: hypothetical protein D6774_03635 [Candidatus Woesearchaeota archaeon]